MRMCGCVAAFCVIWVLCSCGGKSRSAKLRLDSCGIDTTSAVVVEGDTCSVGCYLVACYVKGGSQEQQDFVNKYIALRLLAAVKNDSVSSCLRNSEDVDKEYKRLSGGQTVDMPSFVREQASSYMASSAKEIQEVAAPMNYSLDGAVRMERINDSVLTVSSIIYMYTGGAHGSTVFDYANLNVESNRILTYEDMFKPGAEAVLMPLIKEGLCEYFDVPMENLENQLLDVSVESLPLPQTVPGFTKDGIVFQYQQYEIACYAAGAPRVVIPYEKVKDILR